MDDSILIETRELVKIFGGLRAVDCVSMTVRTQTLHTIIGPNGAGKTTFFNLLSGNIRPTSGKVFYKGRDITGVPPYRRAHIGIGRSFQITNVFPNLSVLENVRLAAQAVGHDNYKFWADHRRFHKYEERAQAILQQVGLASQTNLPARLLPHGGKRKLELGILLASDPDLLLLDEPTAGMAREEIPMLMEVIRSVRETGKKTIILVEHKMDLVMNVSDRISVMHQGQLLAEGTPLEIAANPTVQKAYLGDLYGDLTEGK